MAAQRAQSSAMSTSTEPDGGTPWLVRGSRNRSPAGESAAMSAAASSLMSEVTAGRSQANPGRTGLASVSDPVNVCVASDAPTPLTGLTQNSGQQRSSMDGRGLERSGGEHGVSADTQPATSSVFASSGSSNLDSGHVTMGAPRSGQLVSGERDVVCIVDDSFDTNYAGGGGGHVQCHPHVAAHTTALAPLEASLVDSLGSSTHLIGGVMDRQGTGPEHISTRQFTNTGGPSSTHHTTLASLAPSTGQQPSASNKGGIMVEQTVGSSARLANIGTTPVQRTLLPQQAQGIHALKASNTTAAVTTEGQADNPISLLDDSAVTTEGQAGNPITLLDDPVPLPASGTQLGVSLPAIDTDQRFVFRRANVAVVDGWREAMSKGAKDEMRHLLAGPQGTLIALLGRAESGIDDPLLARSRIAHRFELSTGSSSQGVFAPWKDSLEEMTRDRMVKFGSEQVQAGLYPRGVPVTATGDPLLHLLDENGKPRLVSRLNNSEVCLHWTGPADGASHSAKFNGVFAVILEQTEKALEMASLISSSTARAALIVTRRSGDMHQYAPVQVQGQLQTSPGQTNCGRVLSNKDATDIATAAAGCRLDAPLRVVNTSGEATEILVIVASSIERLTELAFVAPHAGRPGRVLNSRYLGTFGLSEVHNNGVNGSDHNACQFLAVAAALLMARGGAQPTDAAVKRVATALKDDMRTEYLSSPYMIAHLALTIASGMCMTTPAENPTVEKAPAMLCMAIGCDAIATKGEWCSFCATRTDKINECRGCCMKSISHSNCGSGCCQHRRRKARMEFDEPACPSVDLSDPGQQSMMARAVLSVVKRATGNGTFVIQPGTLDRMAQALGLPDAKSSDTACDTTSRPAHLASRVFREIERVLLATLSDGLEDNRRVAAVSGDTWEEKVSALLRLHRIDLSRGVQAGAFLFTAMATMLADAKIVQLYQLEVVTQDFKLRLSNLAHVRCSGAAPALVAYRPAHYVAVFPSTRDATPAGLSTHDQEQRAADWQGRWQQWRAEADNPTILRCVDPECGNAVTKSDTACATCTARCEQALDGIAEMLQGEARTPNAHPANTTKSPAAAPNLAPSSTTAREAAHQASTTTPHVTDTDTAATTAREAVHQADANNLGPVQARDVTGSRATVSLPPPHPPASGSATSATMQTGGGSALHSLPSVQPAASASVVSALSSSAVITIDHDDGSVITIDDDDDSGIQTVTRMALVIPAEYTATGFVNVLYSGAVKLVDGDRRMPHGKGQAIFEGASMLTYSGRFVDGQRTGLGTYSHKGVPDFSGSFQSGRGWATQRFPDGTRVFGRFYEEFPGYDGQVEKYYGDSTPFGLFNAHRGKWGPLMLTPIIPITYEGAEPCGGDGTLANCSLVRRGVLCGRAHLPAPVVGSSEPCADGSLENCTLTLHGAYCNRVHLPAPAVPSAGVTALPTNTGAAVLVPCSTNGHASTPARVFCEECRRNFCENCDGVVHGVMHDHGRQLIGRKEMASPVADNTPAPRIFFDPSPIKRSQNDAATDSSEQHVQRDGPAGGGKASAAAPNAWSQPPSIVQTSPQAPAAQKMSPQAVAAPTPVTRQAVNAELQKRVAKLEEKGTLSSKRAAEFLRNAVGKALRLGTPTCDLMAALADQSGATCIFGSGCRDRTGRCASRTHPAPPPPPPKPPVPTLVSAPRPLPAQPPTASSSRPGLPPTTSSAQAPLAPAIAPMQDDVQTLVKSLLAQEATRHEAALERVLRTLADFQEASQRQALQMQAQLTQMQQKAYTEHQTPQQDDAAPVGRGAPEDDTSAAGGIDSDDSDHGSEGDSTGGQLGNDDNEADNKTDIKVSPESAAPCGSGRCDSIVVVNTVWVVLMLSMLLALVAKAYTAGAWVCPAALADVPVAIVGAFSQLASLALLVAAVCCVSCKRPGSRELAQARGGMVFVLGAFVMITAASCWGVGVQALPLTHESMQLNYGTMGVAVAHGAFLESGIIILPRLKPKLQC